MKADYRTPSVANAIALAHIAKAAAPHDKKAGQMAYARLLMCVPAAEGGLEGLDEAARDHRAWSLRVHPEALVAGLWACSWSTEVASIEGAMA